MARDSRRELRSPRVLNTHEEQFDRRRIDSLSFALMRRFQCGETLSAELRDCRWVGMAARARSEQTLTLGDHVPHRLRRDSARKPGLEVSDHAIEKRRIDGLPRSLWTPLIEARRHVGGHGVPDLATTGLARDDARAQEHFEVVRDGRLTQGQVLGEPAHCRATARRVEQVSHDVSPRRVAQRGDSRGQWSTSIHRFESMSFALTAWPAQPLMLATSINVCVARETPGGVRLS